MIACDPAWPTLHAVRDHGWERIALAPADTNALSVASCPEHNTRSDRRVDDFVGHLSPDQVVKSFACTVARYQIIDIDLLERRDDLPDVIVAQRRHDVEAADERMHLLDARSGLC